MTRKGTDRFFAALFTGASLVSVLALGAILIFVFAQGAEPFVKATAPGIRLVTERVGSLTVNGVRYEGEGTVQLAPDERRLSIRFETEGDAAAARTLELAVDPKAKDPSQRLVVISDSGAEMSIPEAAVYTFSFGGRIAALAQKVHVLLPEPPLNPFAFLSGLEWRPAYQKLYGILPMIAGTVLASLGAVLLGVPAGLLCAVFMAEFLPPRIAAPLRACVELLAGIPSVVYGFFGLMTLSPLVKAASGAASGNCLFSAIIVLAVMILPTVITISETSLRAVPTAQREASLALGATKAQTAWCAVLPHARSGVIAGVILGVSRAAGETMAVILVAGNSAQIPHGIFDSVRTLTSTIALEMGYASGRHGSVLFSIGVVLFVMILALNAAILTVRRKEAANG
jgi:phosphate transport system permease protein